MLNSPKTRPSITIICLCGQEKTITENSFCDRCGERLYYHSPDKQYRDRKGAGNAN